MTEADDEAIYLQSLKGTVRLDGPVSDPPIEAQQRIRALYDRLQAATTTTAAFEALHALLTEIVGGEYVLSREELKRRFAK